MPQGLDLEEWLQTTVHEVTHALGFSTGLYKYYVDA